MSNFLGKYKLPALTDKEEENLNISVIMEKIENIFQELLSQDGFTDRNINPVKNR